MNETVEKAAPCLAITEKKAQRPGGCVGIFFQLFDWNRRFAKKKLFSRKLLPPVRAKSSKRFGGDEKMPKSKFQLIADENNGGFPSMKKSGKHNGGGDLGQNHGMRSPSLVARLMGLESMPAVSNKSKEDSFSSPGEGNSFDVGDEDLANSPSRCKGDDFISEKGNGKLEPRPQKLQKTGQFERGAVTRFGAEALQIKGVFSRSTKHHTPKLPAAKSPRISSARSAARTSRLIDAATRILEPGLQATSKAKSAITYPNSRPYAGKNEAMAGARSPEELKQSCHGVSSGVSLMSPASCKNCGNLLHDDGMRQDLEDRKYVYSPFVMDSVEAYPREMQIGKPQPIVSSIDCGGANVPREWMEPVASREEGSLKSSCKMSVDRKTLSQEGQAQRTNHQGNLQKDEQFPFSFKHRRETETPNPMSLGRERIPPRASKRAGASSAVNTVSGTKNFVAANKAVRSHTRPRIASKVDESPVDNTDRKPYNRKDDSSPHIRSAARKRRTNVNSQADSPGFATSTYGKPMNARRNAMTGERLGLGTYSTNRERVSPRSRLVSEGAGAGAGASGNKNSGYVPYAFSPPLKQKSRNFMEGEGYDQKEIIHSGNSYQRKLISNDNNGGPILQQRVPSRDDLGLLLEQKLRELTSQEEDEMTAGSTLPMRSTAAILQELIAALTEVQPGPEDVPLTIPDSGFLAKAKADRTLVGFPAYGDHLSPGSVLEATFSNSSCVSSSLDDSSGHGLHLDSTDHLYDHPHLQESDAELLDSAATSDKGSSVVSKSVNELLNKVSRTFQHINQAGLRLTGDKLIHVKEVLLNAELFFRNVYSDSKQDFLLAPFLREENSSLESLLGSKKTKDTNNHQLKEFLFDSTVECLDTKYLRYCHTGFRSWTRLPSHMNSKLLMQEVGKEVRKWTEFAGMAPEELIEWEMSHSLGKWTDFDIEAFETGMDIDLYILQILVEEVVVDLSESWLISQ